MRMLVKLQEKDHEEFTAYEWASGSDGVIDVLESWNVPPAEVDDLLADLGNHAIDSIYFPPPSFIWGTSKGTIAIFFCEENDE